MLKRIVCVLAMALVAACVPALAGAATKHKAKNHTASATLQTVPLSSQGNPPISGSSVSVGAVSGPLGNGGIVGTTTFTAPTFNGTFTVFLAHGSLKGTLSGSGTLAADGSASFSGSGKIIGGTDTYKGAKGTFTFTGTSPAGSKVSTFHVTGKVKY